MWAQQGDRRREFWWDGDRLAAELSPTGALRIYIYAGHDALSPIAFVDFASRDAKPEEGHLYHVFSNGVGMPLHIEDARGEIVWWASSIDPYGAIEVHPSARIEYNLRWPGHYFDAETGLHCNRYRYYDPGLGRYLQSDPIGHRGSAVNLYAYCTNPLVQVDVLGLAHSGKGDGPNTRSTSADVDGQEHPPRVGDIEATARTLKISEQGEWGPFDQNAREKVGQAILDNPVSYEDYQRLNSEGVSVVFDLESKPMTESGARIAGEYIPLGLVPGDPPTVVIYVRNNSTDSIASTLSHEATHHDTHRKSPELRNTHADEYNSFRREFEFEHGRPPNASEQKDIMNRVRRDYPELPPPPSGWTNW